MTRDEIEKLSDEELNLMVATEVMEWEWTNLSEDKILVPPLDDSRISWATEWDAEGIPRYLPDYSSDIAAAWQVVEKMKDDGWMPNIVFHRSDNLWHCEYFTELRMRNAAADTAPRAISIAALLAKMQP